MQEVPSPILIISEDLEWWKHHVIGEKVSHQKHTWLLLRGLIRERKHWGHFPDDLQAQFPQDEVITIDLPGNGTRYRQKSPTKISKYAEFLHSTTEEIFQREKRPQITVVAVSLGAMVALEWAHRYPNDFDKLIMINTSLRGLNPIYRRLRPANYPKFLKAGLSRDAGKKERQILEIVSNKRQKIEEALPLWSEIGRQRPVSVMNSLRQLLAAARFKAPKSAPPMPVLTLASRGDKLAHYLCSEKIAKTWNLPLILHENAGHDLCLDDPEWVIRQFKMWKQEESKSFSEPFFRSQSL